MDNHNTCEAGNLQGPRSEFSGWMEMVSFCFLEILYTAMVLPWLLCGNAASMSF